MKNKIYGSISSITRACQDDDGKYIAIPVLGKVEFIDNELHAYVDKFCDSFGYEVNSDIVYKITQRFYSHIN